MITPGIDHIALTVPDLDAQVDRLTSAFGMVVESRIDVLRRRSPTPATGLKLELGRSDDAEVHFRHLGFRADDVDGAHEQPRRRRHGVQRGAPPARLRRACTRRSSSSRAASRSSS